MYVYPGMWILFRRHGEGVTVAEVLDRNARHPTLWDVWVANGSDTVPVNITERGQNALRAIAPAWALKAIEEGMEG